MIRSFASKATEQLYNDELVRAFSGIERQARRNLQLLNAVRSLDDLRVRPGYRPEALKGDRSGSHSIRINDKWRICFNWLDGHVFDVEIVDYH
jgi:proteic killer suppression protein